MVCYWTMGWEEIKEQMGIQLFLESEASNLSDFIIKNITSNQHVLLDYLMCAQQFQVNALEQ